MDIKNIKRKPRRFGWFVRVECLVRRRPFRWLRNGKSLPLLFHRKKVVVPVNRKTKIVPVVQKSTGTPDDHLCYIISQGFHLTEEQDYVALITNPKFRCGHCKRQAASERNLCVPIEIVQTKNRREVIVPEQIKQTK